MLTAVLPPPYNGIIQDVMFFFTKCIDILLSNRIVAFVHQSGKRKL